MRSSFRAAPRGFRAALVAASALALVAACSSGGAIDTSTGGGGEGERQGDGKVHLTMFVWAGAHQGDVPRAVVKEYESSHPDVEIDIVESNNTVTYPKMVAAKRTTPDDNYVDFGFFNASTFAQGQADGMWDTLDPEAIPNMSHVLPAYRPRDRRGVGYVTTVIGMLYNSEHVKSAPTSWSALWDPKYRGRVTTFDYQWEALALAARLNGGSASDIDPGFEVWSKHADQFKALVSSNLQLKNLLVDGDAYLAPWFYSIAWNWMRDGAPLKFVVPKEGGVAFPAYLAMVTNLTPDQKRVAYDIINILLSPKNVGKYAEVTHNIPLTDNAALTRQQASDPNLELSVAENAMQFDWGAIAKHDAEWRHRWDTEVKSKMQ